MERAVFMGKRESSTPFPPWKIHGSDEYDENSEFDYNKRAVLAAVATVAGIRRESPVSARKLAAAAWELRQAESPFFQSGHLNASAPHVQHPDSSLRQVALPRSPSISNLSPRSTRRISQLKSKKMKPLRQPVSTSKVSPAEDAKASVPQELRNAGEVSKFLDHLQSLANRNTSSTRLAAALQTELEHAHAQIQELELSHKAVRKEMDKLLRKLADERAIRRTMEMEKFEAAMKNLQNEMEKERKSKHELEIANSRLGRQLGEANMALFRALQDLERERKTRELLEDVCNEIAQNVGNDRFEVDLNSATGRLRDFQQRQKIIQMADMWRKERVQMKLAEARLQLQEKNAAVDKFRGRLEELIGTRREFRGVMDSRDGRRNSSYEPWEMNGSGSNVDDFQPMDLQKRVRVNEEEAYVTGYHSDSLQAESLRGESLSGCVEMVKDNKVRSRHSRFKERVQMFDKLRKTDNLVGSSRDVMNCNRDIVWEFESDMDVKVAEKTLAQLAQGESRERMLNHSTLQVNASKNLEQKDSDNFHKSLIPKVEDLEKPPSFNKASNSEDSQSEASTEMCLGREIHNVHNSTEMNLNSEEGEVAVLHGELQKPLQKDAFEMPFPKKQAVISSLDIENSSHTLNPQPPRNLRKHFARGFKNLVEWRKHNKTSSNRGNFLA